MQADIAGRVFNTKLPHTKALLPVFEAIVNSIQAIDERKSNDGNIIVKLEREKLDEVDLMGEPILPPVVNVEITDNGVGFTKLNYQSFNTTDSGYKRTRGGKGIGRFLWLKAFEKVEIESIYYESGKWWRRSFTFVVSATGIENETSEELLEGPSKTIIRLVNLRQEYREDYNLRSTTVIDRIIEHCLIFFLSKKCPHITLIDGDTHLLNSIFQHQVEKNVWDESFELNNQKFKIRILKVYNADHPHSLHLCANNREVVVKKLSNILPDLTRKLYNQEGEGYIFQVYVEGEYLDSLTNAERTQLVFPEENLFEDLTEESFLNALVPIIEDRLSDDLKSIRSEKRKSIEGFIASSTPQYRPLLSEEYNERLNKIPYGTSGAKLEAELHKVKYEIERSVKESASKILKQEDVVEVEEYKSLFSKLVDNLGLLVKTTLAEYIVHRRVILSLLERRLALRSDGKYSLEDAIHELIYPLRSTGEGVDDSSQNLWIIDERLTYHKYLASDVPFKKMQEFSIDSLDRPDLLIVNEPFALVENDDAPHSAITIIEFKKPMRKEYKDTDNPISQVYRYIRRIKEGKGYDLSGRLIPVSGSTKFYCYIICDLTNKMRHFAEDGGLGPSTDNLGFFGFNEKHNAWVEVISFDKVLSDAKKRNRVLFDKLSLGPI